MEQIRSAIQQARFCIADVTRSNPNVLYEVGLAHASSKPIILLAEEGSHLPFDLAHQRVVFYGDDFQNAHDALRGAITIVTSQDRMPEATRLLDLGLYRASIVAAVTNSGAKPSSHALGQPTRTRRRTYRTHTARCGRQRCDYEVGGVEAHESDGGEKSSRTRLE